MYVTHSVSFSQKHVKVVADLSSGVGFFRMYVCLLIVYCVFIHMYVVEKEKGREREREREKLIFLFFLFILICM